MVPTTWPSEKVKTVTVSQIRTYVKTDLMYTLKHTVYCMSNFTLKNFQNYLFNKTEKKTLLNGYRPLESKWKIVCPWLYNRWSLMLVFTNIYLWPLSILVKDNREILALLFSSVHLFLRLIKEFSEVWEGRISEFWWNLGYIWTHHFVS